MKRSPVLWLTGKIKKRIPALLVMVLANVANALCGVWFALGTREIINAAVSGDRGAFWHACLTQCGIITGMLASLTIYRHLHERLNADLDRDWKRDLLHVLLRGDYAAVTSYHSGELINRLNNDVRTVNEGILTALPSTAAMSVRLIGASVVLIRLEPCFALVILLAGIGVMVFTATARRSLKDLNKSVSAADGKLSSWLQEVMEKLLMVQAMDVGDEMEARAEKLMEQRYQIQRKRKNVSLLANTCVSVLYQLAGFGALVWCAVRLLNGSVSFGDLTAVTQLMNQLMGPFVNLSGVIPKYVAMLGAAERLMELDDLRDTCEATTEDPEVLYREMTAIAGDGLCFSYDRDAVLDHVSFRLPKGSFTVITGPSGRGKSTLLKLLLGIFAPGAGSLYLEKDHGKLPLDRSTRRLFAYVPQGNLLFSGTLRENLTVVRPEATENDLNHALYVSALEEVVAQLPQGLDTVVGENGVGLSEGQAQRLAIARAVLGQAPVLLLDEATSNLDEETEKTVLERIRQLPDRSCIAVTHRPAALAMADHHLDLQEKEETQEVRTPHG